MGGLFRSPRVFTLTVATFVFFFVLFSLFYSQFIALQESLQAQPLLHSSEPDEPEPIGPQNNINVTKALEFYFQHMFKPSVTADSPGYRPNNAFEWPLTDNILWDQPLGEKLCIIDLDNRPFTEPHQLFGQQIMSWDHGKDVHGLSLGVLNHWIYAKNHGYKYYYVAIDEPLDRRASWKKPSIISKILKKHDVCIYLDSDALFHRLDLPFEWLLNYWQLGPANNSLALAFDPDFDYNKDKFGKIYLNTGFIVAQNNDRTHQIMDSWSKCADDGDPYPECVEFRKNMPGRPTDQGGFGTYVRYEYEKDIVELPCTEANGFPMSGTECHGKFIRHLWTGKDDWIKVDVGVQTPGIYLELLHQQYLNEKNNFYTTEADVMEIKWPTE